MGGGGRRKEEGRREGGGCGVRVPSHALISFNF